MKIGFLTACLPKVELSELVPWAASQGFEALELAAWPVDSTRDYLAHHVVADSFDRSNADAMRALFEEHGMSISALAYYDNNLHPDLDLRASYLSHLYKVIDAAALLEVELVGTFAGARPDRTPGQNLKEIGSLFREVVSYAADRNVKLMVENCPMENWVQFGLPGNYAFSPELWDALFEEVPADNFGLNFDPSHLYWLGIDPMRAAREYASKIFHAHAKDAELLDDGKYRYGVLARQLGDNPWQSGWWRYRMPGRGAIDWAAFVRTLKEASYDGTLSIEHEDPEFEGSEELTKKGLSAGYAHLSQFVNA